MQTLWQDLQFAARILRKKVPDPRLWGVLLLAVAADALVFSITNGLMLRPLNVPQAESLIAGERA